MARRKPEPTKRQTTKFAVIDFDDFVLFQSNDFEKVERIYNKIRKESEVYFSYLGNV